MVFLREERGIATFTALTYVPTWISNMRLLNYDTSLSIIRMEKCIPTLQYFRNLSALFFQVEINNVNQSTQISGYLSIAARRTFSGLTRKLKAKYHVHNSQTPSPSVLILFPRNLQSETITEQSLKYKSNNLKCLHIGTSIFHILAVFRSRATLRDVTLGCNTTFLRNRKRVFDEGGVG